MLRPEPMCKVLVATPKNLKKDVVETLYSLGVLHLKDAEVEGFETATPLENAERISKLLLTIESLLQKLPEEKGKSPLHISSLHSLERLCESLSQKISKIEEEIKTLEEKIREEEEREKLREIAKKLGISKKLLWDSKKFEIIIGLAKGVNKNFLPEHIIFVSTDFEGKQAFLVVVKKELGESMREALRAFDFNEISASELEKALSSRVSKKQIEKRFEFMREKLRELARKYRSVLEKWKSVLEMECEKAEAPLKFGESKRVVLIEGWIPKKEKERFANTLRKIFGKKIALRIEDVKRKENAPVKLSHPKPISSFKMFLEVYSLPKYGEVDPTLFLFITFPIYFGFMLGDIGYGILSLLLALFIRKRKELKAFSNIMLLASLSTIFFGFLYGEFFGAEEILGFHIPHLLSRVESIYELIFASIIFGLVHINIGLLLGFINELTLHGIKEAFLHKGGWFLVEAGAFLFLFSWKGIMNMPLSVILAVFFAGVLLLIKGEGILGAVEMPTLLSHILSYSRLAGVGIASASLAMVVNEIAGSLLAKSVFFLPFVALLVLIGHIGNFLLGLLECSLHSLRLNWVEFFTKFYHGGGTPYKPFGRR